MKLLSIIVPAYNMEAYLQRDLESLVVKDKALLESLDIIVVNDGSTDKTSAIAHGFAERYPNAFQVIDKNNGHYGSCVNRGLSVAKGHFIKILDADDSFDTAEFEKYLIELQRLQNETPAVDLVLSHVRYVDPNGHQTETLEYPFKGRANLTLDDVSALSTGRFIHGYTYRRAIFDGLNYHQSEGVAYTDTEWVFVPATRVKRVAHCPFFVYRYLVGREGQSCSAAALSKQLSQIRQTFDVRLDQYRRGKSSWSPSAIRYAEIELTRSASYLYVAYVQHGYWHYRKELRSLDRTIETDLRPLKKSLGAPYVLFPKTPFKIEYGKLCARHPFARPPVSFAFIARSLLI